jgi:hypothetical protein
MVRSLVAWSSFLIVLAVTCLTAVSASQGWVPRGITWMPAVLAGPSTAAFVIHGIIEGIYRRRLDGSRGFDAVESTVAFLALTLAAIAIWSVVFLA